MPANVRSFEAIEEVRAALATFGDDVAQALSMIDLEMRRVLDWLEHDRPRYWKHQVRSSMDAVTEARADLTRALMYPINDERPACDEERAALKRAQIREAYCVEKEERLRHWIREVRHEMFEYEGRISQVVDAIENDVPHAIGITNKLLARLREYEAIHTIVGGSDLAQALWGDPTPPLPPGEGRGEGALNDGAAASPVTQKPLLPAKVLELARELRSSQTDAESWMWYLLRDRRLGDFKFRRQHPVDPFVLDFYCHEKQLAVELDGGQHNTERGREHDVSRTDFLSERGIRVLRFWNHEVLQDIEAVLEEIWRALHVTAGEAPSPQPSPKGRGGQAEGKT